MATLKRRVGAALAGGTLRRPALALIASALHHHPNLPLLPGLAFYVADSLPPSRRVTIARLRTGSRMLVDLTDHAQRPVFLEGEWEIGTTRLLKHFAFPAWTFVDVGANAGYFSLLAVDLGGPSTRVVSFEPAPRARGFLQASVILNGAEDRIAVRAEACGSRCGTATLSVSTGSNSGRSTLRGDLDAIAGTVDVAVTTVDDMCESLSVRPDVIKIDVEGYEPEVIAGMRRLLGQRVPLLVLVEASTFTGRPSPFALQEVMSKFGYLAHQISDSGALVPLGELGPSQFENLAFTRS